jgi:hypothetical protein
MPVGARLVIEFIRILAMHLSATCVDGWLCNSRTRVERKADTDLGDRRFGQRLDRFVIYNLFHRHSGLDAVLHSLLHLGILYLLCNLF